MILLRITLLSCLAFGIFPSPLLAKSADVLSIFRDGKSFLALDISETQRQQLRALPLDPVADFSRVFEVMTGTPLEKAGEGKVPLRVELFPVGSKDSPLASLPTGFRETAAEISITPDVITIRGETPAGISGGFYKLLESWGARWILPGALGEVIPKHRELSLPLGTSIVQIGSDTGFGADKSPEWMQRNRLARATWLPCFHYWRQGVEPEKYFAQHPEYFALVDGERNTTQPETSNPDVIQLKIEHAKKFFRTNPTARTYPMDPEDNIGFSESPESRALDAPGALGINGLPSMTDRVVRFADAVLQGVRKEFPNKSVGFYSYLNHTLPPVNATVDPAMVVGVTRFGYCNLRMTPTPNTSSPQQFENLVRDWLKLTPNVYIYEYNPPSWGAALPFPNYLDMAESMRRLHKLGAKGFHTDFTHMSHAPGIFLNDYIRARMMVDPTQDPNILLESFTKEFFGPAAATMLDYYKTLAEVTNYNDPERPAVGVSIYRLEEIFPREMVKKATQKLEEARNTPGLSEMENKRIEYVKLGHDYLVFYLTAIDAAKAGQWEAANKAFDQVFRQIALQERVSPHKLEDARVRMEAARSTTLATYFPKERGFITEWEILGPIPRSALDKAREASIFSQTLISPFTVDGQTITWQHYTSSSGFLDFNRAFQRSGLGHPPSKAFASVSIDVPENQDATAFVSSFYPFTVYLNEKKIFGREGPNFDWPDRNAVKIELKKGINRFVILSDEQGHSTRENPQADGFDWSVSLALRDMNGKSLNFPIIHQSQSRENN